MPGYSEERKASILKNAALHNLPVAEVSGMEGINLSTLYNWRIQAKEEVPVPEGGKTNNNWSAEAEFAVVTGTRFLPGFCKRFKRVCQ